MLPRLLSATGVWLLAGGAWAAWGAEDGRKEVLLLTQYPIGRPGQALLVRTIQTTLQAEFGTQLGIFVETLGERADMRPDLEGEEYRKKWLEWKYRGRHFDAVIAVNLAAAEAARNFTPAREAPLIYGLAEAESLRYGRPEQATGVVAQENWEGTIELALRLLPGLRRIALFRGGGSADREKYARLSASIRTRFPRLEVLEMGDLDMETLPAKLSSLPPNSFVMGLAAMYLNDGKPVDVDLLWSEVLKPANAPVFNLHDTGLGRGAVGGDMLDLEDVGRQLAHLCARVLRGEAAGQIPVSRQKSRIKLDWEQVRRWQIDESRIPAGAVVINRTPGYWETHKNPILLGAAALLAETLLVGWLLLERRRRRDSERMTEGMLASLPGEVVMIDEAGQRMGLEGSSGASRMLAGEGRSYAEQLADWDPDGNVWREVRAVARREREQAVVECRARVKDQLRWMEVRAQALRAPLRGAVVAHVDVTARRRAEQEAAQHRQTMAHMMRVASMGELACTLAHEITQPLSSIQMNAYAAQRFLGRNEPDVGEISEALHEITQQNTRAGEIIRKVRDMLKKSPPEAANLDLNQLAREAWKLVLADAHHREVEVEMHLEEGLPEVRGDRVQIKQVLVNLLVNGMDAMKEKPPEERRLTVTTGRDAGLCWAEVADRGTGIPAERLQDVFEPFYTTKQEGLGVGLAISRSLVEAMGGRLTAENLEHGGARLRMSIPVAEATSSAGA